MKIKREMMMEEICPFCLMEDCPQSQAESSRPTKIVTRGDRRVTNQLWSQEDNDGQFTAMSIYGAATIH